MRFFDRFRLIKNSLFGNPSVIFLRKCHLPLHKGGSAVVCTDGFVIYAFSSGELTDSRKRTRSALPRHALRACVISPVSATPTHALRACVNSPVSATPTHALRACVISPVSATPTHALRACVISPLSRRRQHTRFAHVLIPHRRRLFMQKTGKFLKKLRFLLDFCFILMYNY